jgi:hypothetical protein
MTNSGFAGLKELNFAAILEDSLVGGGSDSVFAREWRGCGCRGTQGGCRKGRDHAGRQCHSATLYLDSRSALRPRHLSGQWTRSRFAAQRRCGGNFHSNNGDGLRRAFKGAEYPGSKYSHFGYARSQCNLRRTAPIRSRRFPRPGSRTGRSIPDQTENRSGAGRPTGARPDAAGEDRLWNREPPFECES